MATPTAIKRSTKTVQAGQKQRQSRCIAGNQAEISLNEHDRRSKKKAMRTMTVISGQEGVSQQAQDDYSKFFGQPLSGWHLEALASHFNWSIPNFHQELGEQLVLS
jgi:hypothetical protein